MEGHLVATVSSFIGDVILLLMFYRNFPDYFKGDSWPVCFWGSQDEIIDYVGDLN